MSLYVHMSSVWPNSFFVVLGYALRVQEWVAGKPEDDNDDEEVRQQEQTTPAHINK